MSIPSAAADRLQLERGDTSCHELVCSYLERAHSLNETLNAFTSIDDEGVLSSAKNVDTRLARSEHLPLAGMVLAVKDVICRKGGEVTCGSRMLQGFRSLYDATVVEKLESAGAVIIGKTNCDEFAMGSSSENSYFGPVRNPLDVTRVPGGSSGGSATALRAGMCNTALGSDTGGSIRQPAAFCGVVGLKPTYGRVSRYGLVAYASSFDCIGPFGGSVADVALSLQFMAGADDHDSTSAPVAIGRYEAALDRGVKGMRVGIPREFMGEGLDSEIRGVLEETATLLEREGASLQEVSLPHTEYGIAAYYILTTAEASSNLGRYDGVRYGFRSDGNHALEGSRLENLYTESRTEGFGPEVKRRIMLGTYVLSSGYYDAYYARAQRVRSLIRRDFDGAFDGVDVLLTPATPTTAFMIGSKTADPLEMYLNDIYTVTANLAGIPGLVVPAGLHSDGMPIGLQLLGRHFDEESLLAVGRAVELVRSPQAGT